MSLKITINEDIKSAMKEKDSIKLESLRAIKSAIILFETKDSSSKELNKSDEIKILQRLVKQRKERAQIFESQNRNDLAEKEIVQSEFISRYLPKQLSEKEIEDIEKIMNDKSSDNEIKELAQKEMIEIIDNDNPKNDPDYSSWGNTAAALNYTGLIPYLTNAIQELSRRNDAKELRIKQLETENAQLKSDMALVKQKLGL